MAGSAVHNKTVQPQLRLFKQRKIRLLLMLALTGACSTGAWAAEPLDKNIPVQSYQIPAGDLSQALTLYAGNAGVLLSFDSSLTQHKKTPGLKGNYSVMQGFSELLRGTGLEVVNDEKGALILQKAPIAVNSGASNLPLDVELGSVTVRAPRFYEIGPLPGLGLTKEQIPGNVQSISAEEIKNSHSLSLTDLMNSKLQSVVVNDYQGNPFQMDVQYRGFTASPQLGTPQGLSVFFDGIRVNEPFGDVVNWDLVPMNALAGIDVFPGSNPIFGLGTLGGAITMRTKDGFNYPGVEAEILTGSFGRKQLQISGGINNADTNEEGSWDVGNFALYGAGSFFMEDGWRDDSPSKVNQVFGKASYQGEKLDLNFSTLLVKTELVGNGLLPSEMYARDPSSIFTSPDSTDNTLTQFQLAGSYFVNDNFSITAQAYKRKSKRHQINGDVYTEHDDWPLKRDLAPGEEYTCLYNTTNEYGLPDYYVVSIPGGDPWDLDQWPAELMNFAFAADFDEAFSYLPAAWKNAALPPEMVAAAQHNFHTAKNIFLEAYYQSGNNPGGGQFYMGPETPWSQGQPSYQFNPEWDNFFPTTTNYDPVSTMIAGGGNFFYYTGTSAADSTIHILLIEPATNGDRCLAAETFSSRLTMVDDQGRELYADGGAALGLNRPGVVEGTPTAVITNTQIDQETDGASIQFNWNYDKHKFMIGASIDAPSATYGSGQRFGMLDVKRHAFLAPELIRDQYTAADYEIRNNDFEGSQITKSIYASETWSPIETLHITGAMRYNETRGQNEMASRTWGGQWRELHTIENHPDFYDVCAPGEECETGYGRPPIERLQNKPEKEKFSYYSLNPSLGVSWQAKPSLNIYGNVARGTRTPSVIELGCAFDDTPIYTTNGAYLGPKSLIENRSCSMPTTLSGDPYLPQIKATSFDLGLRGQWGENAVWNVGVYRTNLKDDIYMIGYPGNRNFFDTVGKTRREGLEAGVSGSMGKWDISLNYALTKATFEDEFNMPANANSSSVEDFIGNYEFSRLITVKPGDRMPGVPLHNLNATVAYSVTPKWKVGVTAIAHSESFVRGNENNKHRAGDIIYQSLKNHTTGPGQPQFIQYPRGRTNNPGKVDGFMVFNFMTSYQLAPEWSLSLQVNNIFDKEYFTAGRLGVNPFAPSVHGAIGPSGYNHNSLDWVNTNFLAPGAPRAAWISLSYQFDPRK